ncbi:MAG: FeoA family protein [Candidatus Bathyarchaeia archaeon]
MVGKSMELLPCLLEVIGTLESRGETAELNDVSGELNRPAAEVEEALDVAVKQGLAERNGNAVKLTEKGRAEVLRHRERYVHERHAHRGRAEGWLGGSIRDWRLHWSRRHGLDNRSLDRFYEDIRSMQGRIENVIPLTELEQGRRGVVAFTFGGRGVVQRLAEMGLTPGTEVTIVRAAPFHGPLEVTVRGVSLALGRGVALRVFVKPIE